MQHRIVPNLWFDTQAEEAAAFYTSVFENSRIAHVTHYTEVGPRPAGMEALFNDPDPDRARRAMEAMLQMGKLDIAALHRAADGVPAA